MKRSTALFISLLVSLFTPQLGCAEEPNSEWDTGCPALEKCWSRLFPSVERALSGSQAVVDTMIRDYEEVARDRIFALNSIEGQTWSSLQYQSALSQSYLDDCKAIAAAAESNKAVDVFVVGMEYDAAKGLFERVAETYYSERVRERCGTVLGDAFNQCKKSVVVIHQPGVERLYQFLRMLKPDSIGSFTYVGHGLKDQIVLGPRKIGRYSEPGVIPRKDWVEQDNGGLYVDELAPGSPFAEALRRAVRPDAKITLYSCNTGNGFAGVFAKAAGVPGAMASFDEMIYGVVDEQSGKVVRVVSTDVSSIKALPAGQHLILIPMKHEAFKEVPAAEYHPDFQEAQKGATALPPLAQATQDAVNDLTRSVVSKIANGSGELAEVANKDGTHSIVAFTSTEREHLRALLSDKDPKFIEKASSEQLLSLFDSLEDAQLRNKIQRVVETASSFSHAAGMLSPVLKTESP
jgi:hypothetical protein